MISKSGEYQYGLSSLCTLSLTLAANVAATCTDHLKYIIISNSRSAAAASDSVCCRLPHTSHVPCGSTASLDVFLCRCMSPLFEERRDP